MQSRRSFTLIELLVVVAIIAILAAMLLPVLHRAKAMGRQATCMSNLRQLITALTLYAEDSGDFIPCILMEDSVSPFNSYPVPPGYPANWTASWSAQMWPYLSNARSVWVCPGSGNTETGVNYYPQFGHYGGSAPSIFNWPASFNPANPPMPHKRGSILNPTSRYAIFDSGAYWCSQPEALVTSNPFGSYIPGASWNTVNNYGGNAGDIRKKRHPSGVCVAFLDGHVESMDIVKFCQNTASW